MTFTSTEVSSTRLARLQVHSFLESPNNHKFHIQRWRGKFLPWAIVRYAPISLAAHWRMVALSLLIEFVKNSSNLSLRFKKVSGLAEVRME